MRHVTQDREDDETGEETDDTATDGHKQSVSIDVVVVLVVGWKRQQSAKPNAKAEKYLAGGVHPDFRLFQLLPLRDDVELDALAGTFQGHAAEEQDD